MKLADMTNKQLRTYIDGCHQAQAYDAAFEDACRELNSRETLEPRSKPAPMARDISYVVDQFGEVKLQNQIRVY